MVSSYKVTISLEQGCQTEHSGFCREHDSKGWEERGKCSWHNKGCDETSHPCVTISKTKEPDCHEDPSCGSELLLLQGKLRGRLWDLVKMLGSTLTVKEACRGEETGKVSGKGLVNKKVSWVFLVTTVMGVGKPISFTWFSISGLDIDKETLKIQEK